MCAARRVVHVWQQNNARLGDEVGRLRGQLTASAAQTSDTFRLDQLQQEVERMGTENSEVWKSQTYRHIDVMYLFTIFHPNDSTSLSLRQCPHLNAFQPHLHHSQHCNHAGAGIPLLTGTHPFLSQLMARHKDLQDRHRTLAEERDALVEQAGRGGRADAGEEAMRWIKDMAEESGGMLDELRVRCLVDLGTNCDWVFEVPLAMIMVVSVDGICGTEWLNT